MTHRPQPSDEDRIPGPEFASGTAGHPRRDQVDHCIRVKKKVEDALALEGNEVAAHRDILQAALGHDLYEDTSIHRQVVVDRFGSAVDALIRCLTEGTSVPAYVEQVAKGPEEARLIKYGDLADNYSGSRRGSSATQRLGQVGRDSQAQDGSDV